MTSKMWARIRHVSDETGASTELDIMSVSPLNLVDLIDRSSYHPLRIAGRVPGDVKGQIERSAVVETAIEFREDPSVFVLVDGGWLPPTFVSPRTLLIDRNILALLVKNNQGTITDRDRFWVEALLQGPMLLNPVLCAHEGASRALPSREEFLRSYEQASALIRSVAPTAKVIRHSADSLNASYENVVAGKELHAREVSFLIAAAPLVAERSPTRLLRMTERRLFQIAKEVQLPRSSLALLLALSCLYEDRHGDEPRSARGVLKPAANYTEGDAHNAVSDLRALQFLAMGMGLYGHGIGLCTCDKDLAEFWCVLGPRLASWTSDRRFEFTLTLTKDLFPAADDAGFARLDNALAMRTTQDG